MPSGPDQSAIALSLIALLSKVTRRHCQQHRRRCVPRGFWGGVVLLGISPELIFLWGVCLRPISGGGVSLQANV